VVLYFLHYTYIGKETGIQIPGIDLKCLFLCVPFESKSVLWMWTDRYNVRNTVAYFQ